MRALRTLSLATALLTGTALSAGAQVTGPHNLHFVGGSGVGFNGWQVGTYHATLDNAPISIWCTDFFNHSADAKVWETNLGGNDLSKTRWGTLAGQPTLYKRAAALTSLFGSAPTSEWGYIHYAIWELMSDPLPLSSPISAAAQNKVTSYLTWSLNNWSKFDYSHMYVLTDVVVTGGNRAWPNGCQGINDRTTCGVQEYLTGQVVAAPEPAAVMLMATGLVGLSVAGMIRRRKQP